ncbi:solute carrier family 41 member 2-like isoform X2, partial [Leptotrombidium deliense]
MSKVTKDSLDPVKLMTSTSTNESKISVETQETACEALKQMIFPFVLSGFGNLGAALILSSVELWPVFVNIPQLNALVPPLLGLKGNVELTLSSRLSTHANLGRFKKKKKRNDIFVGNLALVQFQSCIIGLCAPLIVLAIDAIVYSIRREDSTQKITWTKFLVVVGSAVITTNVASIVLGVLICIVIYVCKINFKINPDNVASPIAASCGDIVTMALLAFTSNYIYNSFETNTYWIPITLTTLLVTLSLYWALIAYRNKYTTNTVFTGFTPITFAMIIQVVSGFVLQNSVYYFTMFGVYQIIMTGFGGDLVAVQCSRHSTFLHRTSTSPKLPESHPHIFITPWSMYFSNNLISRFALLLLLIAAPSQIPFLFITVLIEKYAKATALFFITYSITSTTHVAVVVYIAFLFVQLMW